MGGMSDGVRGRSPDTWHGIYRLPCRRCRAGEAQQCISLLDGTPTVWPHLERVDFYRTGLYDAEEDP